MHTSAGIPVVSAYIRTYLGLDFGISITTSPRSIAGSAVCKPAVCRCFMADMLALLLDDVTCPASIGPVVSNSPTLPDQD